MQFTTLGRTGCKVSRLCLGTMNFGPQTTEADSFAVMDKAHDVGINFFDTADVYGWKKGEGVTESIIGRWFGQGGMRRENTVLATKVFGPMNVEGNHDPDFERGLSARKIVLECERSLKRLQTDYIDLYQMHHIAREMPWDECWQAFETLTRQGKIIYAGSSNFAGWNIAAAQETAKARHYLGLVTEQSKYSLACRHIELEVLPACGKYGVGVIPWSPLDGGLLGGVLEKAQGGRRGNEKMQERVEAIRPTLEAWEGFCQEMGQKPADVALAWMLADDRITAPIIGPRTMDQLTGSLRSLEIKLTAEQHKRLDEIWPGPGGQAPEAYAW